MNPGKNDIKTNIFIEGDELDAIQNVCYVFTECFGLDSRIAKYKGKRPLGLYQWDYECLITGFDYIVNNEKGRKEVSISELQLLGNLLKRIHEIYESVYG